MPLSDTAIRKIKPTGKPHKVADENGIFLLVAPLGGKLWRMKYRFAGKEKLISFGAYPDVPLVRAREKRDEARKLLADGVDPADNRKAQKAAKMDRAANSFEVIAREWLRRVRPNGRPAIPRDRSSDWKTTVPVDRQSADCRDNRVRNPYGNAAD